MSDIRLTYDETPLSWPASVPIADINTCASCGIRILAPQPGSLQCLTRRQEAGDGVNIDEYVGIGADYRGQRYTFEEAIFHTPGLHVFPEQKEVYPAEYHIHMRTMSAPIRYITIVLPVSHMVAESPSRNYFAAVSARPDPAAKRPTMETLFRDSASVIQYQGPDIRGRTADTPIPKVQNMAERQFLLVLHVASIRATDLERIPREGSRSTDPRDLPAPGVKSKKTVLRDHLLRASILANPGILHDTKKAVTVTKKVEMDCKPIKVVDGRDVIETFQGKVVDVKKLLGIDEEAAQREKAEKEKEKNGADYVIRIVAIVLSISLGIILANVFAEKFWTLFFVDTDLLHKMSWMKVVFYLAVISSVAGFSDMIVY